MAVPRRLPKKQRHVLPRRFRGLHDGGDVLSPRRRLSCRALRTARALLRLLERHFVNLVRARSCLFGGTCLARCHVRRGDDADVARLDVLHEERLDGRLVEHRERLREVLGRSRIDERRLERLAQDRGERGGRLDEIDHVLRVRREPIHETCRAPALQDGERRLLRFEDWNERGRPLFDRRPLGILELDGAHRGRCRFFGELRERIRPAGQADRQILSRGTNFFFRLGTLLFLQLAKRRRERCPRRHVERERRLLVGSEREPAHAEIDRASFLQVLRDEAPLVNGAGDRVSRSLLQPLRDETIAHRSERERGKSALGLGIFVAAERLFGERLEIPVREARTNGFLVGRRHKRAISRSKIRRTIAIAHAYVLSTPK